MSKVDGMRISLNISPRWMGIVDEYVWVPDVSV
jgi:hypothetical protein